MITYKVLYKSEQGHKVTRHFKSFAAAAGTASALGCVCWLSANISDGFTQHSENMYKYDKHGQRSKVNAGFIATLNNELNKGV